MPKMIKFCDVLKCNEDVPNSPKDVLRTNAIEDVDDKGSSTYTLTLVQLLSCLE